MGFCPPRKHKDMFNIIMQSWHYHLIYKFKGLLNALKNAEKIKQEKQTLSVSNPLD